MIENDGSLNTDFDALPAGYGQYTSRGGVLCDAVGVGKTATALGLILSTGGRSGDSSDCGLTLVVTPAHSIQQWKTEVQKFCPNLPLFVGQKEFETYLKTLSPPSSITKRGILLMDIVDIIHQPKLWYDFRQVYADTETNTKINVTRQYTQEQLQQYRIAGQFCKQSPRGPCAYTGHVYIGPLHLPKYPWRRVIYDEIQDLVQEGSSSQVNLMQLSRTAQHVWLLSATPFPHANQSVSANHELLGFCRLRMNVEVCQKLPHSHPFEIIKRKLYIRSPKSVAEEAVQASKTVTKQIIHVESLEVEKQFYQVELQKVLKEGDGETFGFGSIFNTLRQLTVHPEAAQVVREEAQGNEANPTTLAVTASSNNSVGGAYSSIQSMAKASLISAKRSLREAKAELKKFDKDLPTLESSVQLARAIQENRDRPRVQGPFSLDAMISPHMMITRQDTELIQAFCQTHSKVRTLNDGSNLAYVYGTFNIISFFLNQYGHEKLVTFEDGSQRPALQHYIGMMAGMITRTKNRFDDLQTYINTLEQRIEIFSSAETESSRSSYSLLRNMDADMTLRSKHGSKTASLINFLKQVVQMNEQAIVFSFWHDTLKLVLRSLTLSKINCAFADGSGKSMRKALNDFQSGRVPCLLLSAKAKASGANLQCASHVVLLDPVGESAEHGVALEQQAIGRAVRLGQNKKVMVTRFCVSETLEAKLYEQIELCATQAAERANDSTYVIENAHKTLSRLVTSTQDSDNDVDDVLEVGKTITVAEGIESRLEEAKEQGKIICIDTDNESVENNGNMSAATGPSLTTGESNIEVNNCAKENDAGDKTNDTTVANTGPNRQETNHPTSRGIYGGNCEYSNGVYADIDVVSKPILMEMETTENVTQMESSQEVTQPVEITAIQPIEDSSASVKNVCNDNQMICSSDDSGGTDTFTTKERSEIDDRTTHNANETSDATTSIAPNNSNTPCASTETTPKQRIKVGRLVSVSTRSDSNLNKEGSIGRVIAIHDLGGSTLYDVKYILGGKEKKVHEMYVKLREEFESGIAGGRRQSKKRKCIEQQPNRDTVIIKKEGSKIRNSTKKRKKTTQSIIPSEHQVLMTTEDRNDDSNAVSKASKPFEPTREESLLPVKIVFAMENEEKVGTTNTSSSSNELDEEFIRFLDYASLSQLGPKFKGSGFDNLRKLKENALNESFMTEVVEKLNINPSEAVRLTVSLLKR